MTKNELLKQFVFSRIAFLQTDCPSSKADLAILRRGIGKGMSEAYDAWSIVLDGMPEELMSKSNAPSESEMAIYTALTLYSLHQQSSSYRVNIQDRSFAEAVRSIMTDYNKDGIKRRFDAAVTSNDLTELSNHARGLIQLIKSSKKQIRFNYPEFASDLYSFQYPDGAEKVLVRWCQDFYKMKKEEKEKD